jgi:hypothetical protein
MLRTLHDLAAIEWPWELSLVLGLAFYLPLGAGVGYLLLDLQNQRACTGLSSLSVNTLDYEARLAQCMIEDRTFPAR